MSHSTGNGKPRGGYCRRLERALRAQRFQAGHGEIAGLARSTWMGRLQGFRNVFPRRLTDRLFMRTVAADPWVSASVLAVAVLVVAAAPAVDVAVVVLRDNVGDLISSVTCLYF